MININRPAPELKGDKSYAHIDKMEKKTYILTILMPSFKAEYQTSLVLFGYYSCGIFFFLTT